MTAKAKCLLCGVETDVEFVGTKAIDWTCKGCGLGLHGWMGDNNTPVVQYGRWTRKALEFKARQEAEAVLATANWLRDHADVFPDLHERTDRWNNKRWSSKGANAKVTSCEIHHNCGCCYDSPLEVWPYCEVDGKRVYSDPPHFTVGQKGGGGDEAFSGWAHKLREAGISVAVIDQVKAFFAKQLAQRRKELQDQLDEATDTEEQAETRAELEALKEETVEDLL